MKKTLSILLILASLAGLYSCGETSPDPKDTSSGEEVATTAPEETTDPRYAIKEDLPDIKYNNYSIRILMRNSTSPDWIGDMFSDEATGEVIGDAIYNRNSAVSERFGVKFELIRSSNNNYETDGVNSILAGEDAYDIIVPHARAAFRYAEQSLCLDWNKELTYVDLDKPWWDQDARKSFEINGKLFTMVGDISYQALAQTDCMLFNKTLFDKYGEEYLYQKVLDDKWVFDEFSRLVKLVSDDLDGNGKFEPDKDLFGYATYQWVGPIQALTTGGGRIVETDKDGVLKLTINTERNIKVFEDYFKLLDTDNCYMELNRDEKLSVYDCKKVFSEGRALFMDGNLNDISYMRDMKNDFGIVPAPKYDETCEKYYTNVDSGTNLFIVPITNPDAERTSVILEALCEESVDTLTPAYYENTLKRKASRDNESSDMLDLIFANRIIDQADTYTTIGIKSFIEGQAKSESNTFASSEASNRSSYVEKIDKINEAFKKLKNN